MSKFKKIMSLILSALMVISIFTIVPITASAETSGDWKYEILEDGTAEITKYNGAVSELVIPNTIDGYPVKSIGAGAFKDCTTIKSVTIPDNVNNIGYLAFCDCKNLEKINLPDSIITIQYNAFYNTAYYNNNNWDNGVLYIGNALIEAKNMSGKYSIKPGTTVIADDAFKEYVYSDYDYYSIHSDLEEVIIPDSVKSIGCDAFAGCSLKNVTIPASVVNIGCYAFGYDTNDDIYCKKDFKIYGYKDTAAEDYALDNGIVFYDVETGEEVKHFYYRVLDDGTAEITGYRGMYSKINIPSTIDGYKVTSIGKHAFEPGKNDDDYLLFLSIPDTVTNIGDGAFYGLSYDFSIPESVKNIGEKAFGYYYVEDDGEDINDDILILGADNSAAQKYAKDNGFNFCNISVLNNVSETITIKKGEFIDIDNNIVDYAILDRSIARICGRQPTILDPETGEILQNGRGRGLEALEAGTTKLIVKYMDNPSYVVKEIKVIDGDNPDPVVVDPIQPSNPKPTTPKVTNKKNNPIKVSVKTKTVKAKKLKKKAQKVKAITVKNNVGKVTYKLVKKGITKKIRKFVKLNSKGVITIKKWKKAKKGTYKIKVKVTAAGNSSYNAKTITKTVKVKVK